MFERRKDNRFGMGIILLAYQVFARFQGLAGIPPVTFAALVLQAGMFLKVIVPHSYGDPKAYCLQGEAILGRGELHRLFWAHLEHGSDMHLYYNMLSLIWKGKILEPYYGSVPFAGLLLFFMGTTGVLYAGLADLASEVFRDPSYMNQCAVGFSGVLFALKVLVNHVHARPPHEMTNTFGFDIPRKAAIWAELLIIQLLVPKASFLGHLAGILAGIIYLYGLAPVKAALRPIQLILKHPATLTAGAFLTATHLNLYTKPWTTKHFWTSPTSLVCLSFNEALAKLNLLRFVSAPLEHSGDVHFAICLVSFLIKGYQLEQSRGSKGFLKLVFWGFFNTSLAFVLVTKLCAEAFADQSYLQQCVHGLTGPLFALKVVCLLETDTVWTPAAMFEIFELLILVEERTRIWHLSGALAGFLTYLWVPAYSWTGTGIRLGGRSPNVPDEAGDRVRREPWTRSWGYANYPQAGPNRLQSNLEDTLDEDIDSGSEVSFATNRSPSHFDSEMGSQPRKAKSASPSGYHTDASLEDLNRSFEDDDGTLEEPLEMDDEEIAEIEKIAERRRLHRSLSPSPSLAPKSGNPALPPANGEIGFNKVFRTPDRDEVRRKRLEKFDKQI